MDTNNIRSFLRARAPLFFITSHEERRVEEFLKKLAFEEKMKFVSWSFAAMGENGETKPFTKDTMIDLHDFLNRIIALQDHTMILIKDVGRIIKNQDPEPAIIRRFKEFIINTQIYIVPPNSPKYKPIIFLDAGFQIPYELEKDAVIIDFELIKQNEILDMLQNFEDTKVKFENKEILASNLRGLTESEILNSVGYIYQARLENPKVDLLTIIKEQKKQQIQKSEFLEYNSDSETIDSVGGMDLLKDWLKKRNVAFTDEAKSYGLVQPKGILLVGIPGGGKSLAVKAIADLWQVPLIRFDVGKLFNSLVGASERAARSALKTIDSIGRCVVWIDEIEKGMAGIHSSTMSDAGTTARVIGTILTWLQERKDRGAFIAATSNNIRQLPPELLRKGRFSEIFFVSLPSHSERKEILSIHLKKRNRDPKDFQLDMLAQQSERMVGAEIEESINSSMFEAFAEGREFDTNDVLNELKKIVPISVSMKDQIDDLWKWCSDGKVRFASSDAKKMSSSNVGFISIGEKNG